MSITAHPELPEFDYIKPASLAEASEFLASHPGEARPLLGGTDIFVRMRDGVWKDKYLVDVKNMDGTGKILFDPLEGLTIGAGVCMNRVISSLNVMEQYPLLAEAARSVASYQLRSRATVVGNICNASPAGDTIGACLAYRGILKVFRSGEYREEPLKTFFLGPGRTRLLPGDIVTSLRLPLPPKGAAGMYIKLGRNKLSDLSIVGITLLGYPDATAPSGYRFHIVLASVAPVPLIPVEAENLLAEKFVSEETIREAAELAMQACTPIDDVRSSARYRKEMVRNLTRKGLLKIWENIQHQ